MMNYSIDIADKEFLNPKGAIPIGAVVKFRYFTKYDEEKESYSEITKLVIKVNENYRVDFYYCTANGKFIDASKIIEVIRE